MKTFLLGITVFLCACTGAALALPPGWEWLLPQPQGYTLQEVSFCTPDNGWAVGHWGTIIRTTDGGVNWQLLNSPTELGLKSVDVLSENEVWAAGDSGILIHTTDAGQNWSVQILDTTFSFRRRVIFVNDSTGWVLGPREIFRTTDGGVAWDQVDIPLLDETDQWVAFAFTDPMRGWICSGCSLPVNAPVVMRTEDGGVTWSEPFQFPAGNWAESISFVDLRNGWTSGSRVFRTTDGGDSWTVQSQQSGPRIHFTDPDHGWMLRNPALPEIWAISRTENGGASWVQQFPGEPGHWENNYMHVGLFALDELRGWIVGFGGMILRTTNAGINWLEPPAVSFMTVTSMDFISTTEGWEVGQRGEVQHTTDGGRTWIQQDSLLNVYCRKVVFPDGQNGWILGNTADISTTPRVFHTANGGNTWAEQALNPGPQTFMNDIAMADAMNGWVVGCHREGISDTCAARMYHTTNGGQSWDLQPFNNALGLQSITAIDMDHAWAITAGMPQQAGAIYRTSDGGQSWLRQQQPESLRVYDLCFTDALNGWALTDSGTALHSTDGGANWTVIHTPAPSLLQKVRFISPAEGWIVAQDDKLLHTTDSGETWTVNIMHTEVIAMDFLGNGEGWAASGNKLLHYSPEVAGMEPHGARTSTPRDCRLSSYPNPFNPATTLRFTLPVSGRAKLALYDILGREVRTLEEQVFTAGEHHLSFDGSALASGIYLARLEGHGFCVTQKLLLLR